MGAIHEANNELNEKFTETNDQPFYDYVELKLFTESASIVFALS